MLTLHVGRGHSANVARGIFALSLFFTLGLFHIGIEFALLATSQRACFSSPGYVPGIFPMFIKAMGEMTSVHATLMHESPSTYRTTMAV